MSTLDESSIRQLLPTPNTETQAPTETPIPGTIQNTNPPATGAGSALIFDPDENITYDPLQASRTTPEIPAAPAPVETSAPLGSNVIDLETTPPPSSGNGMGWKFWVILVAILMVVSLVVFFVMRSSMSSSPPQAQAPTLDNLYGAR